MRRFSDSSEVEFRRLLRRQMQIIKCSGLAKGDRFRVEMHGRAPNNIVQTFVRVDHRLRRLDLAVDGAALLAAHASNLENVGEIAIENQRDGKLHVFAAVIGEVQALAYCILAHVACSVDVDRIFAQHEGAFGVDVGIGEVCAELKVGCVQCRAEKERRIVSDEQFEPGEVARVVMEKAVAAIAERADVAVRVDDGECIVVFQDFVRATGPVRRRDEEIFFFGFVILVLACVRLTTVRGSHFIPPLRTATRCPP